jgi:hypothetical protein
MFDLSKCSPISDKSSPSILTEPDYRGMSLNKAYKSDDFPEPVLPTIPTFIPPWIVKLMSLKAGGRVEL